jgi:NAD(P)-dependent dehydrogenase (short-subunit alcohol dehydrogenase family)
LRNAGYVAPAVQQRLRTARILVAGCGIGSAIAESLVRLGCEQVTLIDGDEVSLHNLNRQDYVSSNVGRLKVEALAERLRAINPEARIDARAAMVSTENAMALVGEVDLVLDTIDFLDLEGIVALHDAARAQGKPMISALSVGYGAGAVFFPPGGRCDFRELFGLPASGPVGNYSYRERFALVVDHLRDQLDPDVVEAMASALTIMEDGRPCPAPHVAVGSAAVAALASTMVVRYLSGRRLTEAPRLVLLDVAGAAMGPGIDLGARST